MEIYTGYEGRNNSFMYFLEGAIQKGLVLLTPWNSKIVQIKTT